MPAKPAASLAFPRVDTLTPLGDAHSAFHGVGKVQEARKQRRTLRDGCTPKPFASLNPPPPPRDSIIKKTHKNKNCIPGGPSHHCSRPYIYIYIAIIYQFPSTCGLEVFQGWIPQAIHPPPIGSNLNSSSVFPG